MRTTWPFVLPAAAILAVGFALVLAYARRQTRSKLVHAARKYGKVISAAVFPNWEHVRQEWSRWDLDCFMPMLYHSFYNQDVHWIAGSIRKEIQELKRPRPLYSGLFVPSLKPLEIEIAFTESLAAGASGIVLFELKSMNEEQWSALKAVAG